MSRPIALAILAVAVVAAASLYSVSTGPPQSKGTVNVLYAGSLVNTMEKSVGPAFETATGYTYQGEGHGSLQDAQMIISTERSPEVFISVGAGAMQLLANHNPPLAKWWYSFASDQLVIAYTNKSSFAGQLDAVSKNQTAWYSVLEKPDFKLGVSDPQLDPKGVYAILLFKLASLYYNDPSLAQYLNSTHAGTFAEETMTAELQTGAIDAIVAYKHEAIEQGFSYISLPSKVNFGVPSEAAYYGQVSTVVAGKKTVGSPVIFVITIPETSKNAPGSLAFLKFILQDAKGQTLLEDHGLNLISPTVLGGNASAVPQIS